MLKHHNFLFVTFCVICISFLSCNETNEEINKTNPNSELIGAFTDAVEEVEEDEIAKTEAAHNNTPPQGEFEMELYFSEFGGRVDNHPVLVEIKGNDITVWNYAETPLGNEPIVFRGIIIKHKSGVWVMAHDESEKDAGEIGGCSDGPTPIDFKTGIIEWC